MRNEHSQDGETLAVFCMCICIPFLSFLALPILCLVLFGISLERLFKGKW